MCAIGTDQIEETIALENYGCLVTPAHRESRRTWEDAAFRLPVDDTLLRTVRQQTRRFPPGARVTRIVPFVVILVLGCAPRILCARMVPRDGIEPPTP